ncbi:MAG: SGNH/GDSL hydrolase family protein [Gammaproteobacteria bacterium]
MKYKSVLKESAKTALAVVVVLGIVEIAIRVAYEIRNNMVSYVVLPYNAAQDFGPVPPWIDDLRILEPDDELVWRNRRNVQRTYMDVYSPVEREQDRTVLLRQFWPTIPQSLENNPVWEVSLNSLGFRDVEFTPEKDPSVFRIVCLGDSWTFGANVDQQDAYPQRLSALLKQEFPDADFEVLNLGVFAYTSHQGLLLLSKEIERLQPDILLIGFAMNDSSVAGYRDKDMSTQAKPETLSKRVGEVLDSLELLKLLRYVADIIQYEPWSIGDYMKKVGPSAGTSDEAWIGRAAHEFADYETLEPYTRVSPPDYETNVRDMVKLAKQYSVRPVLLFNELWNTPYLAALRRVANAEGVPLVDSQALISKARADMERNLEEKLGLTPQVQVEPSRSQEVEVIFRVYSADHRVVDSMYISGTHPRLGDAVPNRIAMYDDGTHGDQKAGDKVWSLGVRLPRGATLFYVYTGGGDEGEWQNVDIPDIRRYAVDAEEGTNIIYAPIDTFGRMYMQADGWHTNAAGYQLIAEAILRKLKGVPRFREYAERTTYGGDPSHTAQLVDTLTQVGAAAD